MFVYWFFPSRNMSYYSFTCPFMFFSKNFSFICVDCTSAYNLLVVSPLPLFFPPSILLSFHIWAKHCSNNTVISIEVCVGLTAGSVVKGEGAGTRLQCSCLENPMDGGAWWAAVHEFAQSWTWLKRLSSSSSSSSGKESTYQCRRCGFDSWSEKIPWRRKWQPIPVFLPGKPHGQRSLVGYSPWGSRRVEHNLATEQQQQLWSVSSLSLGRETYIKSIITEVGIKAQVLWRKRCHDDEDIF